MTSWWIDYAMVPAVALGAYLWLIFVLRLSGNRSLSKLRPKPGKEPAPA